MPDEPVVVPQPAGTPTAPLTFKSEEDRVAAFQAVQDRGPTEKDIEEIDRITNAQIVPDAGSATPPPGAQPVPPQPAPAYPAPASPQPAAAPEGGAQPAQPSQGRVWHITEDDIPKETFFDGSRERPFITQKTPQDLFKSLIQGQKRIHYLESKRLPEEVGAAENRVREELQTKIDALMKEISTLRSAKPTQDGGQPPPAAAPQPGAAQPGNPAIDLAKHLEALKNIKPDEALENNQEYTALQTAALSDALRVINDLQQGMTGVKKIGEEFQAFRQETAAERQNREQREERERNEKQQREEMDRMYRGVDEFAKSKSLTDVFPHFKPERTFRDMTDSAHKFMIRVGSAYWGIPEGSVTWPQAEAATSSYLAKTPALMDALKTRGIEEPADFENWVFLDMIDAMRTGWYRNPETQQWEQLKDPVTQEPIKSVGTWEDAFGKWLDVTGKRDEIIARAKNDSAMSILSAINQRDSFVVQPDTGKQKPSSELMSEEEARNLLTTGTDPDNIRFLIQNNRIDEFNRINAALVRLGAQPFQAADFQN